MPKLPTGAVAAACCVPHSAPRLISALLMLSALPAPSWAAGFIDDSHGTLTLRNYYLDRDYKDDGAKTAAREWAQAFILNLESGYTPGPLGFGLDVRGLMGVKLDSSPDRSGTELLPVSAGDKRAADEYSRLAPTAKLRFAQTTVKVRRRVDLPAVRVCQPVAPAAANLSRHHLELQGHRRPDA